jgi:hypothetical protein
MSGPIALLVVHGIGAQRPGETLDKLAKGLRLVDPDVAPTTGPDGLTTTIGGQPVRLYEVYWADLLKGELTRGAFQMNELQSLSWFPWFNLRRGNYRSGTYSVVKLAVWCVALPVINFFVLLGYHGARFFAQLLAGFQRERKPHAPMIGLPRIRQVAAEGRAPTGLDQMLDDYVGDILSYVNSAGGAFYRDTSEPRVAPEVEKVFPRILRRFYDQLVQAHADGCATIQIVAHSLGTVVTYHALSAFGVDPSPADAAAIQAARTKVTRVYTIGSPLEKVRFFWPRIVPAGARSSEMNLCWDNFVSFFDPVSGVLRSFDEWGTVTNHRLLGGGFVMGHVVYEHSPVFLGALTEGLCGRPLRAERRLRTRLWDVLVLIGETLLAPAALALAISTGAALFWAAAALVPFFVSLMVRWFVAPGTWEPVVEIASRVLLGLMVLTFFIAPAIRASKVHALYWAGTGAEPAPPRES